MATLTCGLSIDDVTNTSVCFKEIDIWHVFKNFNIGKAENFNI